MAELLTLTPMAAKQVRIAADNGDMQGLALRFAAKEKDGGGEFEYGMGFDEPKDDDIVFTSEGIEIAIAPQHGPLLKGTVVDYVEWSEGEYRFIFMNPNDPSYVPPKE